MNVSVIIINYNTFNLTAACITSVIKYSEGVSYEIILVDNDSNECDAQLFREKFSNIHLIKNNKNVGFAKGNNIGLEAAKGDYILLLNSDTILLNNAIGLSYIRMKQDNRIGALSCQLQSADGRLQTASNEFVTITKNILRAFRLQYVFKRYDFKKIDLNQEHQTDWIWGTFFMFPKALLNKMPGKKLPDNFFLYMEDRQWCFQIKKLGYKILYYPSAKILHLISASSNLNKEEQFKKYILPNEFLLYKLEKGALYAFLYFVTSSFFYYCSGKVGRGNTYLLHAFKNILSTAAVNQLHG